VRAADVDGEGGPPVVGRCFGSKEFVGWKVACVVDEDVYLAKGVCCLLERSDHVISIYNIALERQDFGCRIFVLDEFLSVEQDIITASCYGDSSASRCGEMLRKCETETRAAAGAQDDFACRREFGTGYVDCWIGLGMVC
jgi:hypothetical protein